MSNIGKKNSSGNIIKSDQKGRPSKGITKEMILSAMDKTKSVRSASRYLNCSYTTCKFLMQMFKNDEGISLFDVHKNPHGKGVPKMWKNKKGTYSDSRSLIDIINSGDTVHFEPQKIKYRLFAENLLKEECCNCGFKDRRVLDYKAPVLLRFKDENKQNYQLDNLEILCYNCYFLYHGDIFTKKDVEQIEEHKKLKNTTPAIDWELDEYHIKRLKEIGLVDKEVDLDDPYSLVSNPNNKVRNI